MAPVAYRFPHRGVDRSWSVEQSSPLKSTTSARSFRNAALAARFGIPLNDPVGDHSTNGAQRTPRFVEPPGSSRVVTRRTPTL